MLFARKSSLPVINFFTGASDGILLPLWLCIVLFIVFPNDVTVLLAIGLVLSVIGAIVFGLARGLGEHMEIRHHHPLLSQPESEKEQNLLRHIGIEDSIRTDMKKKMEAEKALWLKEVKENQLGWDKESPERAAKAGFQTALGFVSGAVIVLVPLYVFILNGLISLAPVDVASLLLLFAWPLLCLFIFTGYKSRFIGLPFWKGGLRGLGIGALTLLLAFCIVYFVGAR